ncbi:MAG: type II 3-dehydroquinate dehydratase [Alphaproteobacteria bacterium]|nr:type II 3-dehydroquinate dehydratase [Alphaproteobacteria bacterium]
MTHPIFVLNGPNLNLLGTREVEIYGHETLGDLARLCTEEAAKAGLSCSFRQSNHEGVLIDWVQEAREGASGLVLNAGGYSHSSIALADAVRALSIPVIEVHLSNIFRRETFRHHSYISATALGVICGLGTEGYRLAIAALARRITGSTRGQSGS